jgi:site-specific DNA recombinase
MKAVMLAVIYARYSPRRLKKGQTVMSIDTQLELCRARCAELGLQVIGEFRDEGISGKSMKNRPGLEEALQLATSKRAAFVSYSLSRWSRSSLDAHKISERLERRRCRLISIKESFDTSTATGRLLFGVLASFAEYEREVISERTSDAMVHHVGEGLRQSSRIPYGWRQDPSSPTNEKGQHVRFVPDAFEQQVIEQIIELHAAGASLRGIAGTLAERGILCRGAAWVHTTIQNVLRRAGALDAEAMPA